MDRDMTMPVVKRALDEHVHVAQALYPFIGDVVQAAEFIVKSMSAGGKLLLCGNGGSAADAQHIAAELTGRFLRDRRPLPALALHVNTSSLSAIGNDYSYEEVFAREVAAHGRAGDVLIAISTSGNSPNVLRAVHVARESDLKVIGLSGKNGGKLKALCDLCLCVPSTSTPRIQEMHILIGHMMCQLIEDALS